MQRRIDEPNKDCKDMSKCNIVRVDSIENHTCSVEQDVKLEEYCFSGHMTRRARRSLQSALSSGLVGVAVNSCNDVASMSLSPSLFTTCCSPSTSMETTQSSVSSNVSINLLSSLTTTVAPVEGSRTVMHNVIKSHSLIAHILTGEDKHLGESTGVDNTEDDKVYAVSQATFDADCSDVGCYLEESLHDSSSILGKNASSATDWDLVAHLSDCSKKEITSPDSDLAPVIDSSMSCTTSTWSKCTVFLITQDETKGVQLRQDIMQALQVSDIKVVKPCEAVDACSIESLAMIWVQVPIPVQDELLCTVSSLRYSSKKATSAYFIAITDKQSDVDLCIHGFDDVYMEPIPKDIILQKYQKMKLVLLSETSGTDSVVTMRDTTSTPESTISLESVRTAEYSQSSTCDSVSSGVDIQDISISELKSTLSVPLCSKSPFLPESTETEDRRSPLMDPQSPSWCRVEHATKEKQRSLVRKLPAHTEKERRDHEQAKLSKNTEENNETNDEDCFWLQNKVVCVVRERIKDSCDQLRVLLPYVKGRKTDMASILEMTVDYLKIVNAALPQDFQSHVIEIMSHGSPTLEGRLGEMEKASTTNRKVNRRRNVDLDLSPLGKKQQMVEKASIHMNYDCNIDQSLNNKMVIRSASHADAIPGMLDKANVGSNSCSTLGCISQTVNNASISKRDCSLFKKSGSSKPKRPHMALVSSIREVNSPSVVYLPAGNITPIKETKKDNILGQVANQSQHFTDAQFSHLLAEGDISPNHIFASSNITSDNFLYQSHPQMNTLARVSASDHCDLTAYGGIYFDGAFCHYYPQLQDPSTSSYFGAGGNNEYVNPNAVLPMTSYVPRPAAFTSSHKFDRTSAEFDRYGMSDQNNDIFNNNCSITGLKPNNT